MGSGEFSPRRGPLAADAALKNKTSIVLGFFIYCGLVIAAFFLGAALPSQPVRRQPEPFDRSQAKGKKVLITGAAGFIGSHVARSASSNSP